MDKEYTYGVARIRALEAKLFSDDTINQLLMCQDYQSCINFLRDKGWGDGTLNQSLEEMLVSEKEKTWRVVKDLIQDIKDSEILTITDEFHNLKAAIKQVCTEQETENVFYKNCSLDVEFLKNCIKQGQYGMLPENMASAAKEATEILLRTGDGQLCDVIMDKAALEALHEAGRNSDNSLIKQYTDTVVTVADIKIAMRSAMTGKDSQFLANALVPCEGISVTELISSVEAGMESLCTYLESAGYGDAVKAYGKSASVFECWCDNKIIEQIKSEKYNSFTVGPIIAFALARENEMKTVKIILSGRLNGFDNDFIRERVRIMYA